MKNAKKAFTMVELIFVIVVLGILAAIAVPKMAATRDDANIAKGRSDIASIRSAIVTERQTRLIKGDSKFITSLHDRSVTPVAILFDGNGTSTLLMYGITVKNADGHWHTPTVVNDVVDDYIWTYVFKILGANNTFTYTQSNGTFDCNTTAAPSCEQLTK